MLRENQNHLCAELLRGIPITGLEPAVVFYPPLHWCIVVGLAGLMAVALFLGLQGVLKGQNHQAPIPRGSARC